MLMAAASLSRMMLFTITGWLPRTKIVAAALPCRLTRDVAAWLAQPEKPEPYLQSTLYTKVVLALLTGRDAADLLDVQRAEHLRLMRELTRRKSEGDLADQLICDHALFHLEADLRWLELTAARLEQLASHLRP